MGLEGGFAVPTNYLPAATDWLNELVLRDVQPPSNSAPVFKLAQHQCLPGMTAVLPLLMQLAINTAGCPTVRDVVAQVCTHGQNA